MVYLSLILSRCWLLVKAKICKTGRAELWLPNVDILFQPLWWRVHYFGFGTDCAVSYQQQFGSRHGMEAWTRLWTTKSLNRHISSDIVQYTKLAYVVVQVGNEYPYITLDRIPPISSNSWSTKTFRNWRERERKKFVKRDGSRAFQKMMSQSWYGYSLKILKWDSLNYFSINFRNSNKLFLWNITYSVFYANKTQSFLQTSN